VLLQACCHNPTGMDPDAATWTAITDILVQRNLLPLLDIAYQGLGDGLDEDARALRVIVEAVPEAIIAYSCNKNFGLYRDRVGALFVTGPSDAAVECAIGNAKTIARTSYSMPPDHGAAVVRLILGDQALTAMWRDELNAMRARLLAIRQALADAGMAGTLDLTTVAQQKGMFSLLPLGRDLIDRLRMEHAIYMAPNGRVNLAGLPMAGVGQFVDALRAVARHKAA
jgi:aromatic-amino-acid transaminase